MCYISPQQIIHYIHSYIHSIFRFIIKLNDFVPFSDPVTDLSWCLVEIRMKFCLFLERLRDYMHHHEIQILWIKVSRFTLPHFLGNEWFFSFHIGNSLWVINLPGSRVFKIRKIRKKKSNQCINNVVIFWILEWSDRDFCNSFTLTYIAFFLMRSCRWENNILHHNPTIFYLLFSWYRLNISGESCYSSIRKRLLVKNSIGFIFFH